MEKFSNLRSLVVPLDRANVDTDAIIPKQFMKSIRRTGFGPNLFDEWRYMDHGEPGQDCSKRPKNPDFSLNQERYQGAQILLTRANFGCGSSREHAPWALHDFGIRAILAPSFADIFYANCFKSGILPIVLSDDTIDGLFKSVVATPGYSLEIDLGKQRITTPDGQSIAFDVDEFRKHCLLNGLDEIGLTLNYAQSISEYERWRKSQEPWLFTERQPVSGRA